MDAERGLCAFPSERLNLPPGFVEQFRQNYDYQRKYKM